MMETQLREMNSRPHDHLGNISIPFNDYISCQQDVPNITHQKKFSKESSSSTIFHYYRRRLFFFKGLIDKFSLVLVRR